MQQQFTTKEIINVINKIRISSILYYQNILRRRANLPDQDPKIEKFTETEQKIENLILGCTMHNERISMIIFDFLLDGRLFNKPENECVYKRIMYLHSEKMDLTKDNLVEELKRKGELELVGGELYIEQLITNTLSEANLRNLPNLFLSNTIIDTKHLVYYDKE